MRREHINRPPNNPVVLLDQHVKGQRPSEWKSNYAHNEVLKSKLKSAHNGGTNGPYGSVK